jgi:dinuclear metal center YbgI/SA1388 family protein
MPALLDIVGEADRLLEIDAFRDYCPNGLQVEGRAAVSQIVTGVSASEELFEAAIEQQADLIITHHGLFWDGDDPRLRGARRTRLALLLGANISLAAYHLPLDAHPTLGNNALIAAGLGAELDGPFGLAAGRPVGWQAHFGGAGIAPTDLVERVETLTARPPLAFLHGPQHVRRIGIVSGGAARQIDEAIAAGLDAFITGEPAEGTRALAREAGIHFIAAGHHATETFGVKAIGDHLAARFGVEHRYVEIANPV